MSMLSKLIKIEYFIQGLFKSKNVMCPHCKSKNIDKIGQKYYITDILECKDCLLNFMNPIYKSSLLSNMYDKAYQAEGSTTDLPSATYLEKLKNENFSNSDKNFSNEISFIKKLINKEQFSLLEIGSSWGYFLFQANNNNINSTGIEISNSRRKYGNDNLNVNIKANINEVKSEKYDAIFTCHVLEHFIDLSKIFQEISNLLVENGYIVISVPNYNYYENDKYINNLVGQIHPIGFNSRFFKKNLPKYNIEIISITSDFNKGDINNIDSDQIVIVGKKIKP